MVLAGYYFKYYFNIVAFLKTYKHTFEYLTNGISKIFYIHYTVMMYMYPNVQKFFRTFGYLHTHIVLSQPH